MHVHVHAHWLSNLMSPRRKCSAWCLPTYNSLRTYYNLLIRSLHSTTRGSTPDGADDSLRKYEDYLDSRSYITGGFGLDDE